MKKSILLLIILKITIFADLKVIDSILSLPEKDIDIGLVCLLLSKDIFPEVDIQQGLNLFNNMAKGVNLLLNASNDKMPLPDKRIGSLNTFLFKPGPWNAVAKNNYMVFKYDESSVEKVEPKALFIPHLIYERKGTCSTMPTLWYIIADRLNWPVKIVRLPGHLFVKYKGASLENIEATAKGCFIPDSQYIKDMRVSNVALKNNIYMKPLSKKEIISTLLVNNAYFYIKEAKDTLRAIKYYEKANKYDPKNAEAIRGIGILKKDIALINKSKELGLTDYKYSDEFYKKRKENLQKKE